jgi:hypothetical protein
LEILSLIEARIAKWMAYSDYCVNSDFGVPHCRTFWIWAGIVAIVVVSGLTVYVMRQFRTDSTQAPKRREERAEQQGD